MNLSDRQALVAAEPLFRAARSKVFIGRQATRDAVLSSFLWLKREMNEGDVAVIFFSVHRDADVERGYPGDTSPWVGRIVDSDRIDGQWSRGRWDLRRKLSD